MLFNQTKQFRKRMFEEILFFKATYNTKKQTNNSLIFCWLDSSGGKEGKRQPAVNSVSDGFCCCCCYLFSKKHVTFVHGTASFHRKRVQCLFTGPVLFQPRLNISPRTVRIPDASFSSLNNEWSEVSDAGPYSTDAGRRVGFVPSLVAVHPSPLPAAPRAGTRPPAAGTHAPAEEGPSPTVQRLETAVM